MFGRGQPRGRTFDWLVDVDNRLEALESARARALTAGEAEQAREDLRRVVRDEGHELDRERAERAEVLAQVEGYRRDIEELRAALGGSLGVDLRR